MASTKTLNAKNLAQLGAPRLAALLIEVSTGNAVAKRRLRLELAGEAGSDEAAGLVRKRLASIRTAKTFVDWQKTRALVADLEAQRRAILDHVVNTDPKAALELLWQFLWLAESIFDRCDDGSGRVRAVFDTALTDLGPVAAAAKASPDALAATIVDALRDQSHNQFERLVPVLADQLGPTGLVALREAVLDWLDGSGGHRDEPVAAGRAAARRRETIGRLALEQIADAQQDVDAYIAVQTAETLRTSAVAAAIAQRLLAAGRAAEALERLDAVRTDRVIWQYADWEEARLAALDALGRRDDAQAFRWALFATRLDPWHLHAYLRRVPAFEDFDAEERAFAHVAAFPDVHQAAAFLIAWPALDRAGKLILARASELNGDRYETLTLLADTLGPKHPLPATVALRAIIGFTLDHARSSRYGHAMRHLRDCAGLAPRIEDSGALPEHDAYERQLRVTHGRKTAFWHPASSELS